MEPQPLEEVVRNVDMRLTRVEQILPTLATKTELQEAIAPLATKEELWVAIAEAIAPLATKEELRVAIAEAIAPLATKVELRETIAEAISPLATKAELQPLATRVELQEVHPSFGRRCVTKVSAPRRALRRRGRTTRGPHPPDRGGPGAAAGTVRRLANRPQGRHRTARPARDAPRSGTVAELPQAVARQELPPAVIVQ